MNTVALALIFMSVSQTFHLPQGLLSALCYVESNHKPKAMNWNDGGSPSVGACQIKEATAKHLGFKGTFTELQNPATNVYYAGKYLSSQLHRYDGDIRKGVAAYNAGSHRVNKYGLTKNRKYVSKVLRAWVDEK